jgi:hypothetical protein
MRPYAVSHVSGRAKTAPGRITRPLDAFCGFQQANEERLSLMVPMRDKMPLN